MALALRSIETIRKSLDCQLLATKRRFQLLPATLLASAMILVSALPSAAQLETGSIVGIVTDSSGAVYAGAQVVIENKLTGAKVVLASNGTGVYDAPVLPLGDYKVIATASGFKELVVDNVHLSVGDRKKVDFQLQPGAITETVTVTTDVPLVNPAQSDLGNTVSPEKVHDLPLSDHSFVNLLSVAPGVVNFGAFAANGGGGNYFQSAVRIEIDGTDASQVDSDFTGPAYNSSQRLDRGSVDAIQELQVVTGNYSAEYGQSNGAIFNIVTKSGTNQFHGGLFEYFRNSALDSSPNYFGTNSKAPLLHINQFGGTIGGPLVKNKVFFFANYEGIRQSSPVIFSDVLDPSPAFRATVPTVLQPYTAQIPLPNGGITSFNPGLGFYNGVRTASLTENNVSFKIDANVTNNDKLSFRWNGSPSTTLQPFGISEGQSRDVQGLVQDGRLSYTKILTSHLYNEASVAFNRMYYLDGAASTTAVRSEPVCFGSGDGGTCFGPTIFDIRVGNTSYSYLDTLSWVKGKNQFKFGFQAIRNQQNKSLNLQNWLTFQTQSQFAANAPFADTQLGVPMTPVRITYWSGFAQDDLQLTQKLSLNLGLRYSYDSAPTIAHNLGREWDFANNSLAPLGGVMTHTQKNEFAPRVGFAYAPFGSRKTVVRGAFGIFYNDINVAEAQDAVGNAAGINFTYFDFNTPGLTAIPPPTPVYGAPGHTVWTLPTNSKGTYTDQWNFTIQQQLGTNNMFQVAYVGNRTENLVSAVDINQIQASGQRLYPFFGNVNVYTPCCRANYNGLQATFKRRFSSRLSADAFYTWSHTLDDGQPELGGTGWQDQNNIDGEYGNSDLDFRHNLTVDYVYQLPDLPRTPRVIGGGWQVSGITQWRSGQHYTIFCGNCNAGTGDGSLRPNLILPESAILTGNNGHHGLPVLNTSAFAAYTGYGVYGDLHRNTQVGPDAINFDISAGKSFRLTEKQSILFRAEFLNAFNHPTWGLPDANISNGGDFGLVHGVSTGRNIQLVARYDF